MATVKQEVRKVLEKLPDEASLEDIQYRLYVLQRIERGREDIETGRVIPQDDVEARRARIRVPGLVESEGSPITNDIDGSVHRARIHLPEGFEYTYAEMGTASSTVTAAIELNLKGSYGQFNEMHLNQDGVIR